MGVLDDNVVYISGPITGIENYKQNFEDAEKKLRQMGLRVANPVRFAEALEEKKKLYYGRMPTYKEYMETAIATLFRCDSIYFLPGWKNSKGARLEYRTAKTVGIQRIYISGEEND